MKRAFGLLPRVAPMISQTVKQADNLQSQLSQALQEQGLQLQVSSIKRPHNSLANKDSERETNRGERETGRYIYIYIYNIYTDRQKERETHRTT